MLTTLRCVCPFRSRQSCCLSVSACYSFFFSCSRLLFRNRYRYRYSLIHQNISLYLNTHSSFPFYPIFYILKRNKEKLLTDAPTLLSPCVCQAIWWAPWVCQALVEGLKHAQLIPHLKWPVLLLGLQNRKQVYKWIPLIKHLFLPSTRNQHFAPKVLTQNRQTTIAYYHQLYQITTTLDHINRRWTQEMQQHPSLLG